MLRAIELGDIPEDLPPDPEDMMIWVVLNL